jgi:hypothetical protein
MVRLYNDSSKGLAVGRPFCVTGIPSTSTPGPFREKHLNPRPLLLKEKGRALSLRRGSGEVD